MPSKEEFSARLPGPRWDASREPSRGELFQVVLLNDDDHSYEYVIRMLANLFDYSEARAFRAAKEVDEQKEVILAALDWNGATKKRDQILAYGPDPLIARCQGSMAAVVRPVGLVQVVLLDDSEHSADYVAAMVRSVLGSSKVQAECLLEALDANGEATLATLDWDSAERLRDDILDYGPDVAMKGCTKSMQVVLRRQQADASAANG